MDIQLVSCSAHHYWQLHIKSSFATTLVSTTKYLFRLLRYIPDSCCSYALAEKDAAMIEAKVASSEAQILEEKQALSWPTPAPLPSSPSSSPIRRNSARSKGSNAVYNSGSMISTTPSVEQKQRIAPQLADLYLSLCAARPPFWPM